MGAFKNKMNAMKTLNKATSLGFNAKVVKDGELYKVRVSVKAKKLTEALKKVRAHFKDAFLVR